MVPWYSKYQAVQFIFRCFSQSIAPKRSICAPLMFSYFLIFMSKISLSDFMDVILQHPVYTIIKQGEAERLIQGKSKSKKEKLTPTVPAAGTISNTSIKESYFNFHEIIMRSEDIDDKYVYEDKIITCSPDFVHLFVIYIFPFDKDCNRTFLLRVYCWNHQM